MSSIQSGFAKVDKTPTKFSALITPSYDDSSLVSRDPIRLPIPFMITNQVLDINVKQSSVIQTFVNNGTPPADQSSLQAKAFGGASLINSLGPNMTTYLRNWIGNVEGQPYTGPLFLYIRPFMTKVQMANPTFGIDDDAGPFRRDRSWGITTEAPSSGEYTGGGQKDNFFTAWIFKTPMSIRYEVNDVYKYITMTSQFAEE